MGWYIGEVAPQKFGIECRKRIRILSDKAYAISRTRREARSGETYTVYDNAMNIIYSATKR